MHSYKKGGFILKLIIDGFGKSVAKRDNQIVIKENGKEKDFFLANEISQILFTGKGSITFDALSLLAEHDVFCASINWKAMWIIYYPHQIEKMPLLKRNNIPL